MSHSLHSTVPTLVEVALVLGVLGWRFDAGYVWITLSALVLYIVFTVQPWHHNIGRAILRAPKVCFFDTGLVRGDEGVRFENAVATCVGYNNHSS